MKTFPTLPRYAPYNSPALPVGLRLVVTHGCPTLGIVKGAKANVVKIERETCPNGGYRIQLWLLSGRNVWLHCASSARFNGEVVSLNDGNPMHKVQFVRV